MRVLSSCVPACALRGSLADVSELVALESFWRSDVLASSEAVVRRRLSAHATGQPVVEASSSAADGLLAAMYTQRVPSYECLLSTTRREAESGRPPARPTD